MIFDLLTASPNKTDIPDFLSNLIMFLKMVKKKIKSEEKYLYIKKYLRNTFLTRASLYLVAL